MKKYIEKLTKNGNKYFVDDKVICLATHPQTPNYSGHARGRKMHLSIDCKTTICQMKYENIGYIDHFLGNECKTCFKNLL